MVAMHVSRYWSSSTPLWLSRTLVSLICRKDMELEKLFRRQTGVATSRGRIKQIGTTD